MGETQIGDTGETGETGGQGRQDRQVRQVPADNEAEADVTVDVLQTADTEQKTCLHLQDTQTGRQVSE